MKTEGDGAGGNGSWSSGEESSAGKSGEREQVL